MSSDNKPNKPMPSAAEINAYLEQSAARTRMRLPLAKGAAAVVAPRTPAAPPPPPPRAGLSRALPLQGKAPVPSPENSPRQGEADAWRPFGNDDER